MKLFVTFGVGQYGRVLANCYLEFEGEASAEQAEMMVRQFMKNEFKGVWCGLYDEAQFAGQRESYQLSRLAKLDLHGNIRDRISDMAHCSFSTGIDGKITAGRGALDDYGFWEFPCEPCATRAQERLTAIRPYKMCECPKHQKGHIKNNDPNYTCIDCGGVVPTL
jgi:hypothetical protein